MAIALRIHLYLFIGILTFGGEVRAQALPAAYKGMLPPGESSPFGKREWRRLELPTSFGDSLTATRYAPALRNRLAEAGFLAASVDSIAVTDTAVFYVYTGPRYAWAQLVTHHIPQEYLAKAGFHERLYRGETFNPRQLGRLINKLLDQCDQNGYPFAQVWLDSVVVRGDGVNALLLMDRYTYTTIDSVIIKGGLKTNHHYITRYLSLNKGAPYNQALLNEIPQRLREIPFARVIKPYEVGMREGKCDVYLYLDSRKASNLDGILGLQPNNLTGQTVITGDVQFNIMNGLRQGETINLRWQRLQTGTSQLDLRFDYPFIAGTPLGGAFKMNVFRRDTLFSQLQLHAGVNYFFKGPNYVQLFVENLQTNLISAVGFQANRFADTRSTLLGAAFAVRQLDYRFNPRKGHDVMASLSAGYRNILRNPAIDNSFYDGLELRSLLYNANVNAREFFPVAKRAAIMVALKGGALLNPNMFRSEAYRIGGLKSLRGFDEQSIFATSYAILTLEYKYLLEENSNLFVFLDQGWYEDRFGDSATGDTPFGFGAGINFETRAGIFSLTYALGRQFTNDITLRSGKVHFGFSSFF
jgi:outer membrane protein assembly factor BamA